jgi:hypothetical protein
MAERVRAYQLHTTTKTVPGGIAPHGLNAIGPDPHDRKRETAARARAGAS